MDGAATPVGYVMRAHGIRGDVLVKVLSDHPDRFVPGAVFATSSEPPRVEVTEVRPHKLGLILAFREIGDRNGAEAFVKTTLSIDSSERRMLEADEFWPDDLVGLSAVDPSGSQLGTVVDVVLGAAQDRLVVETPGGERVEVPFVSDLVDAPGSDSVVMHPPQGLFADEPSGDASG